MAVACIACDSQRVALVGPLPVFVPENAAAGGQLTVGSMYRCPDCSLQFRAPAATEAELATYYSTLSSDDWWQHDQEREVWREIKAVVDRAPGRSVLDVGCFRGDLLDYLGDSWERFGVELSTDARRVAKSRGIKIISSSVEALEATDRQFAAITLVDVIEHLPRPLESLKKLADMLMPGGLLVIFTGNTKAWSWRFAGTHYWYSAMPEHVAFFQPAWFRWAAPKLKCRVSSIRRLRYEPASMQRRLDETLKNIAYVTYQRLSGSALSAALPKLPILGRIARWNGSWWTTARDHMLVTLVKQN
jgi:2-polyprenyl-3-methyl-5-hydroxy-6-metoxy-1,4-benzoquinol methylase